jgi:hypothetical protein
MKAIAARAVARKAKAIAGKLRAFRATQGGHQLALLATSLQPPQSVASSSKGKRRPRVTWVRSALASDLRA